MMHRSIGFCFTQIHNEGVPIEQRRGIELLDLNDYLVLVQAPIEEVGQALCQTRQVASWQRNVYEHEIELIDQESTILVQFRKHPWTIIGLNWFLPNTMYLDDEAVQSLSAWMHTKAITYLVSDGGGHTGYHFFNDGESLERLYCGEDVPVEETNADVDEIESMVACEFRSQLRQKEAHEIGYWSTFINEFLQEQDAYVPACKLETSLKVGQKVTLKMKGIERDDLERMDYITLSA
jgi:hypothetical protein